nr:hypothetical transcript [Hymenolepis microstoma]
MPVTIDCRLTGTITLAHLSGRRRKKFSPFDEIHESSQFLASSYELKCWSARPCGIERVECGENETEQHLVAVYKQTSVARHLFWLSTRGVPNILLSQPYPTVSGVLKLPDH